MIKLIIFDLDGTLLDTLQDLTNSVNYAMTELNLPTYSSEQVREMVGNGAAVLMQRAVTSKHLELHVQAMALQRGFYAEHDSDNTRPYAGITEMLAELKKRGYVTAVFTNKDETNARSLCGKHFGKLIDYVLGTTSDIVKPNPEKILRLMDELGAGRQNAVYCGDSDVDINTAKNAQIRCVSVTWGFKSADFLIEHGAKRLADSPEKLLDAITELL